MIIQPDYNALAAFGIRLNVLSKTKKGNCEMPPYLRRDGVPVLDRGPTTAVFDLPLYTHRGDPLLSSKQVKQITDVIHAGAPSGIRNRLLNWRMYYDTPVQNLEKTRLVAFESVTDVRARSDQKLTNFRFVTRGTRSPYFSNAFILCYVEVPPTTNMIVGMGERYWYDGPAEGPQAIGPLAILPGTHFYVGWDGELPRRGRAPIAKMWGWELSSRC